MRAMRQSSAAVSARSRRDFLKLATAAGVGSALHLRGQDPAADSEAKPAKKIEGPVAIVGGGIAGLTAAYRLVKEGVEVHLYEAQNRFGGRMFTKRDFNQDGMFIELGGELVDTNHEDLIALAGELGVEIQSLKEGEQGIDFYHYNGRIYTDKDVIEAFGPLSERIAKDAEGLYDDKEEFTDKARQLDNISLYHYLKDAGATTEPWLLELLETAYVPEFGRDTKFQSCLNFVDFINPDTSEGFQIFGDSDEAFRIQGGNDTLPTAVQKALEGKVKFHSGHQLVRIGEDGSKIKLTFTIGSKLLTPSYDNVIITIPFTTLRSVEGIYDLKLSEEKKRSIKEMGFGSNIKIMYGFTGTPWRDAVAGRDFICNGSVYSDQPYQTIWETSRGQKGSSGIITNFMGGTPAEQYTTERLDKFLVEIDQVFPGVKAKFDGNKIMMNWPQIKTMKGSYSCPLVGQYTWVYGAACSPELDGHLHFAGEHTSFESPGYMNGGVESGNRAAAELLA
jgi:monoamine oxidase